NSMRRAFFSTWRYSDKTHFPGRQKNLRVLDRGLMKERIRTRPRVTLNHVQLIAAEVSGSVEPDTIIEAGHVDDQSLAFPMPDRLRHAGICRRRTGVLQIDVPERGVAFISDCDGPAGLKDLKQIRPVRGAENAGQITLDLRIFS